MKNLFLVALLIPLLGSDGSGCGGHATTDPQPVYQWGCVSWLAACLGGGYSTQPQASPANYARIDTARGQMLAKAVLLCAYNYSTVGAISPDGVYYCPAPSERLAYACDGELGSCRADMPLCIANCQ